MQKLKKAKGLTKLFGLMFRTRKTVPLVFEFKKDTRREIHSLFVFFPFKAIWLDKNNRILDKRIIRPFSFSIKPGKKFRKLIEIPLKN